MRLQQSPMNLAGDFGQNGLCHRRVSANSPAPTDRYACAYTLPRRATALGLSGPITMSYLEGIVSAP